MNHFFFGSFYDKKATEKSKTLPTCMRDESIYDIQEEDDSDESAKVQSGKRTKTKRAKTLMSRRQNYIYEESKLDEAPPISASLLAPTLPPQEIAVGSQFAETLDPNQLKFNNFTLTLDEENSRSGLHKILKDHNLD